MKFLFLSRFTKKFIRNRLRRIMRGYRYLRNANSLDLPGDIAREFTIQNLNINQEQFSKVIFGAGIEYAEIISRQYLLLRCAGLNFNKSLLYAFGKSGSPFVHYLPLDWRKIVQKKNVSIAPLRMSFLWNAFIIAMLIYGFLTIAKIIRDCIYALFRKPTLTLGSYVYFNALSSGNIPRSGGNERSHDIITWYMQWNGRNPVVNALCHGVKGVALTAVKGTPVVPISFIIPPIPHFGFIARFIVWGIWASLLAAFDLLRGRWWHALLLNQAALAAQVRFQDPKLLAQDYLFHNSVWFFRPLWTYEVERHNARIIMYFYSTNCEPFKQPNGYPVLPYGWQIMNWPYYIVWDEYQAEFVRRAAGDTANISVVGQIWFNCSTEELPALPPKSVAVFDVQPVRESFYRTLGLDFEYYTPKTANQFLFDIHAAMKDFGGVMCLKRKRKIGRLAHPKYRNCVDKLHGLENIVAINPETAALRLIESCVAAISMPFTSTALIARKLGKPSCYYDPTGLIQKDDRGAHGIIIISGPEELADWLKALWPAKKNR